jgi:hypothetical protein
MKEREEDLLSEVITLRLSRNVLKRLDKRAEDERRSRANMARLILEEALEKGEGRR